MDNMFGGQDLADYIGCDISSINNYARKGMPYIVVSMGKDSGIYGLMGKNVRMFDIDEAKAWILENASNCIKRKIKSD